MQEIWKFPTENFQKKESTWKCYTKFDGLSYNHTEERTQHLCFFCKRVQDGQEMVIFNVFLAE